MESTYLNELFDRMRQGDRLALDKLYGHFYHRLCDFACQIVKSPDLAEEVVSDVFLLLWQKRESLTIQTTLRAYLYSMVRNQALLYVRKENIYQPLADEFENTQAEYYNPLEALLFHELDFHIDSLINQLPEPDRLILRLKLSGLKYAEIAQAMELSEKTIEYRLSKSIDFLRKTYQKSK
ncbi:RNA polymerase sigma-70 factor [Xanthocytophaga agilis]|uniref:RNA polymerase sigma-70 factor n=1 Tax=Xanthocytophaga agilis TaxID=3048010 RepID=A0AAE3QZZ8_9BACT|nr:RNA polymerase sigma-70 factor [Xanthocytophaga agilis]MDJ1499092.1 RNA polymerase sigma-70 factor [Xanthocytophaga agilis]